MTHGFWRFDVGRAYMGDLRIPGSLKGHRKRGSGKRRPGLAFDRGWHRAHAGKTRGRKWR